MFFENKRPKKYRPLIFWGGLPGYYRARDARAKRIFMFVRYTPSPFGYKNLDFRRTFCVRAPGRRPHTTKTVENQDFSNQTETGIVYLGQAKE